MSRINNNDYKSLNESIQNMNEQWINPTHLAPLGIDTKKVGKGWFVKKPDGTWDVFPDWLWDGSVGPSFIQTVLNTPLNIPGGEGQVTDPTIVRGSDDFDINDYDGYMGMPTDDNLSGWNPNP